MNKHINMASRHNGAKSRIKKTETKNAQNVETNLAQPNGSQPAPTNSQAQSAPINNHGLPNQGPGMPQIQPSPQLQFSPQMQASIRLPRNGTQYKILIYCRVSKDDAKTGSHTLETQIVRAVEAADRKFGVGNYTYEILTDDGLSGGYGHEVTGMQKKTRPTLKKIAEMLDTKIYDGFIIYDSSRFMRNTRAFNDFVEDHILANEITLVGASENIDVETSDGRFIATIMAAKNTKGRDDTIYRTQDAARRRAEKGYVVGNPPYGWRYQDLRELDPNIRRGIVAVPEQVKVVRLMKDWYVSGWSTSRIAGELNRMGLTTVTGRPWRQESIRNTLASPVHSGQVALGGKLYLGAHFEDRLWDPEEHEQLVQLGASRKKWHPRAATESVSVHLLEGLVFCHHCGKRLYTIKAQKEYRAYRCINGQTHGQRTCPHLTVQAQALEQQVVREAACITALPELGPLLEQAAAEAAVQQDADLINRQAQLLHALEDVKQQISRWAGLFNRGKIAEEQYLEQNLVLLTQKAEFTKDLDETEAQLSRRAGREKKVQVMQAAIQDFSRCWLHLNLEERRQLLFLMLETCSVERVGRDITLRLKLHFLPEREVLLMIPTGYKKKVEGLGPHALTPRHLAFLHHLNQGKTTAQAGEALGIVSNTTRFMMTEIRKRMGMHDIQECAAASRSRIASLLHSLPLGLLRPRTEDGKIVLSEKLLAVFPMLAASAKLEEVATHFGLPITTVANRKKDIVKRLGTKTIFEAAQKARALGLLR